MRIIEINKDELNLPVGNKNTQNKTKEDLEQLLINKMYSLSEKNKFFSGSEERILELLLKNKD